MKKMMILAMMMVMTISANAMLTCTSPQYITMLQQCTILYLLRITQRLL